jgi:hypothetical protein
MVIQQCHINSKHVIVSIITSEKKPDNIGYTRRRKTKQEHNTICVGHHYAQTNTNNINKK